MYSSKTPPPPPSSSTRVPVAATNLATPLINDTDFLHISDLYARSCAKHPVLAGAFEKFDFVLLRQKLSLFLTHILGGLSVDLARLRMAHKAVVITDAHYDAMLQVLDKVLDEEHGDGRRLIGWKLKIHALFLAENFRDTLLATSKQSKEQLMQRNMQQQNEALCFRRNKENLRLELSPQQLGSWTASSDLTFGLTSSSSVRSLATNLELTFERLGPLTPGIKAEELQEILEEFALNHNSMNDFNKKKSKLRQCVQS